MMYMLLNVFVSALIGLFVVGPLIMVVSERRGIWWGLAAGVAALSALIAVWPLWLLPLVGGALGIAP